MTSVSLQSLHPFLEKNVTELHGEEGKSIIHSYVHDHGSGVILCAVHGYPQSSYMWRHVIPHWKEKYSIFLPELPGYGISETASEWDKRKIGKLLIDALHKSFKDGASRPIVWCSHDRGARIGHRLLATKAAGYENIVSAIFMDIVPTRECWRGFQNPAACIGYFHWPFLAQPDAPALLERMGGDVFTDMIFKKGSGANEAGTKLIYSDGAVDHYNALFKTRAAIEGSCADYKYGGMQESKEQDEDQAADRKIDVPLLVLYSASNIGRACNVEATWKPYTHSELTAYGIGDDIGHYLPESAPEVVAQQVIAFVDRTVPAGWSSKLS